MDFWEGRSAPRSNWRRDSSVVEPQRRAHHYLNLDEGAMDRRILVVDDSELICQQLSQLLALPDRQISVASRRNGRPGVAGGAAVARWS